MATYSYSILTKIPLTPQQIAAVEAAGTPTAVPESVQLQSQAAARALARSTFGSSYTESDANFKAVKDGNYITETPITSPSLVSADKLNPSITPVEGTASRVVEAFTPVTTADTALIPVTPVVINPSPIGAGVVVNPPPPPPNTPAAITPAPIADTAPLVSAPVPFEPLTVGGRILAPAEFEGAADRLAANPPPTTNPNAAPDPNTGGVADLFTPPTTAPKAAPPGDNDATGGAGTNVNQEPPITEPKAVFVPPGPETEPNPPPPDAAVPAGVSTAAATNRAQGQSTDQTRVNQPAAADWRVKISLAKNSTYLYNAPPTKDGSGGPGILAPLTATNGVIFPYTPSIETSYTATYANTPLTHSNYKGQFYQSSSVGDIVIRGTFTAQDTKEASYMLAVIHFFRSVTKMFYGQDPEAGTPPPLVYLSGLGQYQFNNHPCVVTNFTYNLPTDVDYIRANGFNNIGLNMSNRRNQSSGPGPGGSLGAVVAILNRLKNAGLKPGGTTEVPNSSTVNQNVTNQNSINSTYVPTKMEISVTLTPIQTRSQVSQQFSLKNFANGDLLKGGFW